MSWGWKWIFQPIDYTRLSRLKIQYARSKVPHTQFVQINFYFNEHTLTMIYCFRSVNGIHICHVQYIDWKYWNFEILNGPPNLSWWWSNDKMNDVSRSYHLWSDFQKISYIASGISTSIGLRPSPWPSNYIYNFQPRLLQVHKIPVERFILYI